MGFGALRALVTSVNFSTFGVAVTIERPTLDAEPIEATGIWLTPRTEDVPVGTEFQRRERRRVMALRATAVSSVPRGTVINAPETEGGTIRRWRVDGIDSQEPEQVRVVLVPDFDLEA